MITIKKIAVAAALILLAGACNSSTSSSQSTTPSVSYLTISEWNLRFQETSQITDLRYQVDPQHDNNIDFTSASLLSLSQQFGGTCTLNDSPLGMLTRVSNFDAFTAAGHTKPESILIGTWYYYFTPPSGACSSMASAQNLQSEQSSDLQNAIFNGLMVAPKS
jgi:hypothetical protein